MRAFKRDVTDSSFNMEAVSMNNVTFLYGGVPSLTRQLSALFPFLLTYLFFFPPLFSLFIFALFNSVCESWKDKFHMPWYRRKYFHNWICSHWLVDVKKKKKYSLSICEAAITSERERTEGKVCAERKEDMSVIYILLCWKCGWNVMLFPSPPMTPLLSLLMWLLLICILYK